MSRRPNPEDHKNAAGELLIRCVATLDNMAPAEREASRVFHFATLALNAVIDEAPGAAESLRTRPPAGFDPQRAQRVEMLLRQAVAELRERLLSPFYPDRDTFSGYERVRSMIADCDAVLATYGTAPPPTRGPSA